MGESESSRESLCAESESSHESSWPSHQRVIVQKLKSDLVWSKFGIHLQKVATFKYDNTQNTLMNLSNTTVTNGDVK